MASSSIHGAAPQTIPTLLLSLLRTPTRNETSEKPCETDVVNGVTFLEVGYTMALFLV